MFSQSAAGLLPAVVRRTAGALYPWTGAEPMGDDDGVHDYDGGLTEDEDDMYALHDKTKDKRNRRLQYGAKPRKEEDRINRRSKRRRLFRVSTRVGRTECVVSVFHAIDTELDLDFNVYVPRIRRACEIRITGAEQRHCMAALSRTRPGRAAQGGHRLAHPPFAVERRAFSGATESGARLERAAGGPDPVKDLGGSAQSRCRT